jgi:hypothetical protein
MVGVPGHNARGWGAASVVSSQEWWRCWTEAVARGEWSRGNGAPIGVLG